MADKTWNKNVRFNMNSEDAVQAWSLLHSDEVDREFKSQNEFIICAINDFYKRHISTKNDPYLETREKEDAFVDRIVEQVTAKILTNIPVLAGMYLLQQQTALAAGLQNGAMMNCIFTQHQLVLSSYVVEELKNVVRRKFPKKEHVIDKLLLMMSFEYVYTPKEIEDGIFDIRDVKDYLVLYTAIIEDVDILVMGDKDFADIDVEKPEIMTPAEFMEEFL